MWVVNNAADGVQAVLIHYSIQPLRIHTFDILGEEGSDFGQGHGFQPLARQDCVLRTVNRTHRFLNLDLKPVPQVKAQELSYECVGLLSLCIYLFSGSPFQNNTLKNPVCCLIVIEKHLIDDYDALTHGGTPPSPDIVLT